MKVNCAVLITSPQSRPSDPGGSHILKEVEKAVLSLKQGKSPGQDNIPKLIKHGGSGMVNALTAICQHIWKDKAWSDDWVQSIIIPIHKKGDKREY